MSQYTTGELAKLCGVSVRTVQYYDTRGILVPSALTEGGRRLYSEDDLQKMRIICFLREAGLPINSISALFAEKNPENIISTLLDEQERELCQEINKQRKKLDIIESIRHGMRGLEHFSVESIGDIAHSMKKKNELAKMRWLMLLTGLPVTALEWVSIILWITNGLWWLFVIWACVAIPWGIGVSRYYYKRVSYICPECHAVFRPSFREMFWAYHTPKMRRLTCPKCGRKGLCVEVYADARGEDNG